MIAIWAQVKTLSYVNPTVSTCLVPLPSCLPAPPRIRHASTSRYDAFACGVLLASCRFSNTCCRSLFARTPKVRTLDRARANWPTERVAIALTANLYLKLLRVTLMTPRLSASIWKTWKTPPSSSGSQVIRAYQSTRPLTNWRKQPSQPPTRRHDQSHLIPWNPPSDEPLLIPRAAGLKRPWYTKLSRGTFS